MSQEQKERAQRQEEKQDDQLPGYPHYPAGEDITDPRNGTQRISANPEDLGPDGRRSSVEQRDVPVGSAQNNTTASEEGDVSPEDVQMLAAAFQNRDMDDPDNEESMLDAVDDDGDPLNEPAPGYGAAGADLDVPGSEDDDGNENIGEEDEENNYYSIGSDNADALEDDNTQV